MKKAIQLSIYIVFAVLWFNLSTSSAEEIPPNFKVAFIGDSGADPTPGVSVMRVYQLISDEGADMVLHQGDLGYGQAGNPTAPNQFEANINTVFGSNFPYFYSIGNHDIGNWHIYTQRQQERLNRIAGSGPPICTGDHNLVKLSCKYQGLPFIMSGIGTVGFHPDHENFIINTLAAEDPTWRICAWHKNQTAMQVGSKPNEVGWTAYEACRAEGAIIATGHEHSYHRTKTLSSTINQTVLPGWDTPTLASVNDGSTFVFVSGSAGRGIRDQDRCFPTTPPYGCNGEWASLYTSHQNGQDGALFIEFNYEGNPKLAHGYFKDVFGNIPDDFYITTAKGDHPLNWSPPRHRTTDDTHSILDYYGNPSAATNFDCIKDNGYCRFHRLLSSTKPVAEVSMSQRTWTPQRSHLVDQDTNCPAHTGAPSVVINYDCIKSNGFCENNRLQCGSLEGQTLDSCQWSPYRHRSDDQNMGCEEYFGEDYAMTNFDCANIEGYCKFNRIECCRVSTTGISNYGSSSNGGSGTCPSNITVKANRMPQPGLNNFKIKVQNAPPNSSGVLIIGVGQDIPGTSFNGINLHVDLAQFFLTANIATDANGNAQITMGPFPGQSIGVSLFAQYVFLNTASCGGGGTFSASDGLAITIQP